MYDDERSFHKRSYNDLENIIEEYNWDDGFVIPQEILNSPDCDLALALKIFYLADGYAYLEEPTEHTALDAWSLFISTLYRDIINGRYVNCGRRYEIPLTRVQRYKLQKKQVPEIFL